MQNQHAVGELQPIIHRIDERGLLAVCLGVGEIVVLLERVHVDLGERLEIFAGEQALLLGLQPLGGEGREHLVERPGMAHAGDRAVGRIDELALHGDPDVRMGKRRVGRREPTGQRCNEGKAKTAGHRVIGPKRRGTISFSAAETRRLVLYLPGVHKKELLSHNFSVFTVNGKHNLHPNVSES